MIAKLLKHEIRRTSRWLAVAALGATLIVGLAAAAAVLLPAPLNGLFAMLAIIVAVVLPLGIQLWLGIDFYRSSYARTGYLTHALPIPKATIFRTKLGYAYVVALIFLALGLALTVVAAGALSVTAGGGFGDPLRQAWDSIAALAELLPAWLVAVLALFVLVLPLSGLAQFYFAATVGSESWINRAGVGGPILVWFLYYIATQVASLLGLLLPLTVDLSGGEPRWMTNPLDVFSAPEGAAILPLGAFVVLLVVIFVSIHWAKVSFSDRVELR